MRVHTVVAVVGIALFSTGCSVSCDPVGMLDVVEAPVEISAFLPLDGRTIETKATVSGSLPALGSFSGAPVRGTVNLDPDRMVVRFGNDGLDDGMLLVADVYGIQEGVGRYDRRGARICDGLGDYGAEDTTIGVELVEFGGEPMVAVTVSTVFPEGELMGVVHVPAAL